MALYKYDTKDYDLDTIIKNAKAGLDDYIYGDGVTVIEWADYIDELMPEDHIKIRISRDPGKGSEYRLISVTENGK